MSAAHGEAELAETLEASEHAFRAVRRAIDTGRALPAAAAGALEGGVR